MGEGLEAIEAFKARLNNAIDKATNLESLSSDLIQIVSAAAIDQINTEGARSNSQYRDLAPSTVRQRLRLNYGGAHPILVRTGTLRSYVSQGFKAQVEKNGRLIRIVLGNDDPQLNLIANTMHFGSASRNIPPRKVVKLNQQDRQQAKALIKQHITSSIKGILKAR